MDLRQGIIDTAGALGVSPLDLATVISYETAGTFDPAQPGPTTQFGQHRGLIQFGEPQAKQHGVDWNNAAASQLGPNGAIASYMRGAGVQPGMGLLDLYSAVNAGRVGRYNASDAHNGGAWGTVADKVNHQMDGHKRKAAALLGGEFKVAQDTMKALGRAPTPSASQPMVSTRSAPMQAAPEEEKLLGGFLSKDKRDYLIMALEGMTLNPNRALMAQAGRNIENRRQDKQEAKLRNKSAQWLRSQGNEQLAQLVEQGLMSGRDGVSRQVKISSDMQRASQDPSVQSSSALPDQSGTMLTMRDGSVRVVTAGGETLEGQAAVDYVRQAQEKAAEYQRSVYQARREGTNEGDISTGRDAEFERAAGRTEGKAAGESAVAAPQVIERANTTIELIDSIANDPNLPGITGKIEGRLDPEGLSGLAMSQDEVNLAVKVQQLQGKAFLEAFETLKGGGQITEREGQAAQNAIARLQRIQSPEEYRKALMELRRIAENGVRRARGETVPEFVPAQTSSEGTQKKRMKYNPETGRLE